MQGIKWLKSSVVMMGILVSSVLFADINPTQAAKDCYNRGDYKGFASYLNSFDRNDVDIQFDMGWCLSNGQGFAQNYEHARGWYELAANQGSSAALNNLGSMYENGQGVPIDYTKAGELYLKSARMGNAWGNRNYGRLIEFGKGYAIDLNIAKGWYEAAVKIGGCPHAQEDLNRVKDKLNQSLDIDSSKIEWRICKRKPYNFYSDNDEEILFRISVDSKYVRYKNAITYQCEKCGGRGYFICEKCHGAGEIKKSALEKFLCNTGDYLCRDCAYTGRIKCGCEDGQVIKDEIRLASAEEIALQNEYATALNEHRRQAGVELANLYRKIGNMRVKCNVCNCEYHGPSWHYEKNGIYGKGQYCNRCPHKKDHHVISAEED